MEDHKHALAQHRRTRPLLGGALLSMLLCAPAWALTYSVTDLGFGQATTLSDKGEVVGVYGTTITYWPASGSPKSLPSSAEVNIAEAYGISEAGDIVAWLHHEPSASDNTRWDKTLVWNVNTNAVTYIDWPSYAHPYGITKSGLVYAQGSTPITWSAQNGFISLTTNTSGATANDLFTNAVAADSAGNLLVTGVRLSSTGAATNATYLWTPCGSVSELFEGYSTQYTTAFPTGINDKGQVTGYALHFETTGSTLRPFAWVPKVGFIPLTLATANVASPKGINKAGRIVGTRYDDATGTQYGFSWTLLGGIQSLTKQLNAASSSYTITAADGINSKGQILAKGKLSTGAVHVVILTPVN